MDKGAVFGADLDFILWGNDNTAATLAGAELVTGYTQKMTREWKAAVNSTPGTVTVRIILAGNTGAAGNYALHVDDDGVFTSGVISSTAGSSISGYTITFNAVSIANGNFFTLGYKPITAPGAVTSNLSLWLKANTGVEEGASNPAEDGDVVTSWLDQSASGNDATAVVTPTFATNSVNFNPAVTLLDGSSEYFTVAGLNINPSTTDFSMIAVHRSTNSGDDQVIFSQSGGEDLLALESGSDAMYAEMDNNKRLSTGPNIYDEWNLYGATYSGADGGGAEDLTFYQKGDPDGGQNNITAISETGSWIIGTRPNTTDDYWNGEFAELIVYAQDLDASAGGDLHKIESYLAIKYGITLDNTVNPNGDYYTSDATLLWDASANSVYHNDVAGIGRDDGSGLDQQKSISSNTGSVLIMDEGAAFGTDLDFILWVTTVLLPR